MVMDNLIRKILGQEPLPDFYDHTGTVMATEEHKVGGYMCPQKTFVYFALQEDAHPDEIKYFCIVEPDKRWPLPEQGDRAKFTVPRKEAKSLPFDRIYFRHNVVDTEVRQVSYELARFVQRLTDLG